MCVYLLSSAKKEAKTHLLSFEKKVGKETFTELRVTVSAVRILGKVSKETFTVGALKIQTLSLSAGKFVIKRNYKFLIDFAWKDNFPHNEVLC